MDWYHYDHDQWCLVMEDDASLHGSRSEIIEAVLTPYSKTDIDHVARAFEIIIRCCVERQRAAVLVE